MSAPSEQVSAPPGLPADGLDRSLPIVRLKHPSQWIYAVILLVVAAEFVKLLITNPRWEWTVVGEYIFSDLVLGGLFRTVMLAILALIGGLIVGLVLALMRMSGNPVLRLVSLLYLWVIRAIPVLVLLLFTYFLGALLPTLSIGVPLTGPALFTVSTNEVISKFTAALICLVFIEGAYIAEIIRGGLLSVPAGQREAAEILGMTDAMIMRRIILPQSIRVMLPALGNQFVTLFKNTSIVSFIGYAELLTTVQQVYQQTFQTIPLLLVACIWYLVITSAAMLIQYLIERRYNRGSQALRARTPGRSPLAEGMEP